MVRGTHRQKLLEAAARIVSDEGPAGLTMQRLSRVTGFSRATVHRQSGGREALLDALAASGTDVGDRSDTRARIMRAAREVFGRDLAARRCQSDQKNSLKVIAANTPMINAYRQGVPGNGKHFPEGSKIVKIESASKKNPESPYVVTVPDTLKSVSFIEKDSKRFPNTSGWGFAQFAYDAPSDTFKRFGNDAACGYQCHTVVAAKDYIFTAYPKR